MSTAVAIVFIALGGYLVGSLPIGYFIGRAHGVNLFERGSGNIGATNVGRVLGRFWGILVFLLDGLKGVLPTLAAEPLLRNLAPNAGSLEAGWAEVTVAAAAFLGHLFPVFLGFRGGKGVATGAGTVLVLMPIPAGIALAVWFCVALGTRYISLASILAVLTLVTARFTTAEASTPASLYCLLGAALVIVKHRANLERLWHSRENQIGDGPMRQSLLRVLHVMAVGLWFGAAAFFNFAVAPSLNRTYAEVVRNAPSDRTAFQPLGSPGASEAARQQLGSALFGAGVGPIFPIYFALMSGCGTVALATASAWRNLGRIHKARFLLAVMALACALAGWPISNLVSELRLARFNPEEALATVARSSFATWHLVSLSLSAVTVLLAGVLLILTAWLPDRGVSSPG